MSRFGKVIGQYKCGCTYGPCYKRQRLSYCGIHGSNIMCEYPDLTDFDKPIKPKNKKIKKETKNE